MARAAVQRMRKRDGSTFVIEPQRERRRYVWEEPTLPQYPVMIKVFKRKPRGVYETTMSYVENWTDDELTHELMLRMVRYTAWSDSEVDAHFGPFCRYCRRYRKKLPEAEWSAQHRCCQTCADEHEPKSGDEITISFGLSNPHRVTGQFTGWRDPDSDYEVIGPDGRTYTGWMVVGDSES